MSDQLSQDCWRSTISLGRTLEQPQNLRTFVFAYAAIWNVTCLVMYKTYCGTPRKFWPFATELQTQCEDCTAAKNHLRDAVIGSTTTVPEVANS